MVKGGITDVRSSNDEPEWTKIGPMKYRVVFRMSCIFLCLGLVSAKRGGLVANFGRHVFSLGGRRSDVILSKILRLSVKTMAEFEKCAVLFGRFTQASTVIKAVDSSILLVATTTALRDFGHRHARTNPITLKKE
ncbi:hypothetical protein CEXT_537251 [Caerostris extrusa]|uniref:Uncharacterized protein n=1 Tax=Caerostris extrusa TaxID=172846 RepID=A0AAV4S332_CAEEX|nr:hypothetical protein CEXT_537251 [Caerostris extrusa]